jgi:phosphoglycolate phosphatase
MADQPTRAIIFDLDGTLIDSAVQITVALNQLLARRGGAPVDKSQTRGWISLGATRLVAHALGECERDPVEDVVEFRALYGALTPDPADLFAGVADALSSLRDAGYRMGVCTAKPQGLAQRVLDGAGIAQFFDAVVGGRDGMPAKPDPAQVYETLSLLGARAGNAIYVGDSEVDAEAAAAAGLPFLLATFGYAIGDAAKIQCAARFDDFGELPELIRAHVMVPARPTFRLSA